MVDQIEQKWGNVHNSGTHNRIAKIIRLPHFNIDSLVRRLKYCGRKNQLTYELKVVKLFNTTQVTASMVIKKHEEQDDVACER